MAERNTKKLWWFVLGGLAVLVVALVAGILVINTHSNKEPEQVSLTVLSTKEMLRLDEQAAVLPVEEAKALYEEAISTAATELEREQVRVEYGQYLMKQGLVEEGLNKLLTVDDQVLGAAYKMLLYGELRDYFGRIGNDELFGKYNNMISETMRDSKYAAGG